MAAAQGRWVPVYIAVTTITNEQTIFKKRSEQWVNDNKKLQYELNQFKGAAEKEQGRLKAELIMTNAENKWLRQTCTALVATTIVLAVTVRFLM